MNDNAGKRLRADVAGERPTALNEQVRHLRLSLLWPLRLMPLPDVPLPHLARRDPGQQAQLRLRPWQVLRELGSASPWREVEDEYTDSGSDFQERHYHEFVTFLPYVQRFLYGEGRTRTKARAADEPHAKGDSPMRVFRRHDVAAVRVVLRAGEAPITLRIAHIDLYFFLDVDLVLLNVEVAADELTLSQSQELLYRLGRGYPAGWDKEGHALHAPASVEWLNASGDVLVASDAQQRELFLAHVCEHRAPRLAADWAYLLHPLVSDHSEASGPLRFRQIEYYRMPLMAYLAVDNPRSISRSDYVRLGLVTGAGEGGALPFGEDHLADFEQRFCYDRFWTTQGAAPNTRYLVSGHSMVVVGDAQSTFFGCHDHGVLAQFRHQHFLLFLIAHFQKAALLMYSDKLVEALKNLDVQDPASIRRFKRAIRACFEGFLRFTHRYWFHEVAEQAQARALFHLCAQHLGLDRLYGEVKERISDMSDYLDADSLRRQANTVVRLTVVTIFGLVGTITTGFLGMNLLAEAEAPMADRLMYFGVTFVLTTALTLYTMMKSKRLSDFLDALSDERLSAWNKCKALATVWFGKPD
jgi:hypothetical protein